MEKEGVQQKLKMRESLMQRSALFHVVLGAKALCQSDDVSAGHTRVLKQLLAIIKARIYVMANKTPSPFSEFFQVIYIIIYVIYSDQNWILVAQRKFQQWKNWSLISTPGQTTNRLSPFELSQYLVFFFSALKGLMVQLQIFTTRDNLQRK